MIEIKARVRDGAGGWETAITVRCRTWDAARTSGLRRAARRLGLHGPILGRERVGASQFAVNVDGRIMMVVESGDE